MRNLVAILLCAGVVACVSEHEALRNDRGQVVNCSNEGWGWIGAPVAMANQSDCIKKAEAAGFHKPGIADTAASSPTPATPAQKASAAAAPSPPEQSKATSAPVTVVTTATPTNSGASAGSTADRLKKLDDLFKSGLVTKDEYDKKRQEILSAL